MTDELQLSTQPGMWRDGVLPSNVRVGVGTILTGEKAFKSFYATAADAMVVGKHSTLDGLSFAVGKTGRLIIGDFCCFTAGVLLAEELVTIGNYVRLAWNVAITDTDFHPLDPALRIADAIACSPLGDRHRRPHIECKPVVIEDDVYVGPNATILKGVRVGAGSFIEAGALVTRDVPPRSRVAGNPARIIGSVDDPERQD
jgi:acetyltransferase-like isoleucine patch superfamily enzyme